MLEWLREQGFPVNPMSRRHETFESMAAACEGLVELRCELDYDIDGCVVKIDRRDQQEALGSVGRDPRWAIAFKFPPTTAVTRLLDIGVNVGRTGALNPYAVLEPVAVGGVIVRMATLHNEDVIQPQGRAHRRSGDHPARRRRDPAGRRPVLARRDGSEREFRMPDHCPACGTEIVRAEGEAVHRCTNPFCPSRGLEGLRHFVSRGALDIDGVGEKLMAALLGARAGPPRARPLRAHGRATARAGWLPAALGGERDRLDRAVEAAAVRPGALRARHPARRRRDGRGDRTALPLADALRAAGADEIAEVDGVGPIVAESVAEWMAFPSNAELLDDLAAAGLTLELSGDAPPPGEGPLAGLTFVITGTLPRSRATRPKPAWWRGAAR